jgi:hypothetical protein
VRTIIDLPSDQIEALDVLCRRDGLSRAEAVRRAVAEHVQRHRGPDADRAFGLWRGRRTDGVKYQRRVRGEWDARS